MVNRKSSKGAISGFSVIIVMIGLLLVGGAFFYFDPAPSPVPPECNAGEIPLPAKRLWWCVPARKP